MTRHEKRAKARTLLEGSTPIPARERLRAVREVAGLGEDALGKLLSVSGPTVHEWEHGTRHPTAPNRQRIEAWSIETIGRLGLRTRPLCAGDWPHAVAATEPA